MAGHISAYSTLGVIGVGIRHSRAQV